MEYSALTLRDSTPQREKLRLRFMLLFVVSFSIINIIIKGPVPEVDSTRRMCNHQPYGVGQQGEQVHCGQSLHLLISYRLFLSSFFPHRPID